jgi:hypothetical protein
MVAVYERVRRRVRALGMRPRTLGLGTTALLATASLVAVLAWVMVTHDGRGAVGIDYGIYMDATHRWLAGGGWYVPAQLSGPAW